MFKHQWAETAFSKPKMRGIWALFAIILLDYFLWHHIGAVGVAASLMAAGMIGIIGQQTQTTHRQSLCSFGLLVAGGVVVVINLSPLSFAVASIIITFAVLRLSNTSGRLRGLCTALLCTLPRDIKRADIDIRTFKPSQIRTLFRDWGLAVVCSLGFGFLLIWANPVFSGWINTIPELQFGLGLQIDRLFLWVGLAFVVWPLSRLQLRNFPGTKTVMPSFRTCETRNALVVFNALFALQTLTDMAILTGGAQLPDGMSMAEYVHRGAYPLLLTALLAGAFAMFVVAAPDQTKLNRMLLLVWIGQTVSLVAASALRLQIYISDYGLTHLRIWAALWMAVTAIGLLALMWNIAKTRPFREFIMQAMGLACAALYGACFLNFAGIAAHHNVARAEQGGRYDRYYTCHLGENAAVALVGFKQCGNVVRPKFEDWREWSLRSHIIRAKLSDIDAKNKMASAQPLHKPTPKAANVDVQKATTETLTERNVR